jgi:anti-sigma factor RsiW
MKPQTLHAHEDRLLDFVYGELPPQEALAVKSHLDGCSRCSELLAGMRGVRTTMAQLPMEPAPDAGLESLLAYAQQAARNAAAGPAPKPTWWRRWLVPAMGVTAVGLFGVISVTANKALDLKEAVAEPSTQSVQKSAEAPSPAPSPTSTPEGAYPEPSEERAPVALPSSAMQKAAPQAQRVPATPVAGTASAVGSDRDQERQRKQLQDLTPPPPAPAAKLDTASLAKEASKKPLEPSLQGVRGEWSNAGTGPGFGDTKDSARPADDESAGYEAAADKKGKSNYTYDRRDAMTQSGAFSKPKPILVAPPQVGSAGGAAPEQPSTPAAQAPMMEEAPVADGLLAQTEAQVQQEAPSRGSLKLNKGRTAGAPAKSAESSSGDDFDDLFGAKTSAGKREQNAPASPPPPPVAAAMPTPSVSTSNSAPRSKTVARAEPKGQSSEPSAAELSKLAQDALRSGDRVLEAQLLRQALAAGVSGKERLGLLNRLCDAEFASGRRQEAYEACALVLEEDPRSNAAQMARSRLRREGLEADDAKPGTGSRGPVKAAPAEKKSASDAVLGQ